MEVWTYQVRDAKWICEWTVGYMSLGFQGGIQARGVSLGSSDFPRSFSLQLSECCFISGAFLVNGNIF